jgi:hypothetical protein
MESEARKATDVLLDLESKVDQLLNIVKAQDLNIKILSNKLNEVMKSLDKQPLAPPKITVEAVQSPVNQASIFTPSLLDDPEKFVPILAESKLPQENIPQGFRRTSRPEGYTKTKASPLPEQPAVAPQMPMQMPKPPPGRSFGETVLSAQQAPVPKNKAASPPPPPSSDSVSFSDHNAIPIEQRVVNGSNKSIWLADVEILDTTDNSQVFKTRTTGTGKWSAALPVGVYRVIIRKRESVTKDKVENIQTITVDGTTVPLKLPTVIIK